MKRSRAELAAHLMKAARGADLPLAVCEDLYSAAFYLSAADVARIALDMGQGGPELGALMIALDEVECGRPVPLSSSLATALAAARGWRLQDGRKIRDVPERPGGPLEISDGVWEQLDHFAARTYVPESEESRSRGAGAGAGAGAIDND